MTVQTHKTNQRLAWFHRRQQRTLARNQNKTLSNKANTKPRTVLGESRRTVVVLLPLSLVGTCGSGSRICALFI
jgi:hypothetical protein